MPSPVLHFEIQSNQAEALNSYYGSLFGWHIDNDNPMKYGMVDTGAGDAAIRGGIGPAMGENRVTFYVGVDDVEASLAHAEELGGKRLMGPMDVPDGPTIGLFSDPEGNVLGLLKQ